MTRRRVEWFAVLVGAITIGTAFGTGLIMDPIVAIGCTMIGFCIGVIAAGLVD